MDDSNQNADEAQIRSVLDEFVNALRVKDRDKILSLYLPDAVTFDVVPPLHYVGAEAYGKSVQRMFEEYRGPIGFETRELNISVGADVAFSHSLVCTSGTLKSGEEADRWLRRTVCLRKIGAKWLIAHEHISLPVNLKSGSVVPNLKP
jgi:ketosteroid isomerase-like protein